MHCKLKYMEQYLWLDFGAVLKSIYTYNIKTHDSELQGQEEAAVHNE